MNKPLYIITHRSLCIYFFASKLITHRHLNLSVSSTIYFKIGRLGKYCVIIIAYRSGISDASPHFKVNSFLVIFGLTKLSRIT